MFDAYANHEKDTSDLNFFQNICIRILQYKYLYRTR
jgi:hypothetical protein